MTYTLIYQHDRLELDFPEYGKAFYIDFQQSRYQPQNRSALKQELLAKAVGIKKNFLPRVIDLTAGLGQDAYLLHCLGCEVRLVERSPIIAALLKDGLKRANCAMPLYIGEAKTYLHQLSETQDFPEVIYFDPIFPEKNKTALSQKSARILRAIAGKDEDAEDIFKLALTIAQKRVVVKRYLQATLISSTPTPDIVYKGKSIRFDVYLC